MLAESVSRAAGFWIHERFPHQCCLLSMNFIVRCPTDLDVDLSSLCHKDAEITRKIYSSCSGHRKTKAMLGLKSAEWPKALQLLLLLQVAGRQPDAVSTLPSLCCCKLLCETHIAAEPNVSIKIRNLKQSLQCRGPPLMKRQCQESYLLFLTLTGCKTTQPKQGSRATFGPATAHVVLSTVESRDLVPSSDALVPSSFLLPVVMPLLLLASCLSF